MYESRLVFSPVMDFIPRHTLLDLRSNIPAFIHISDGRLHDVNILDQLLPEREAFYIMDSAYLDFSRLYPGRIFVRLIGMI